MTVTVLGISLHFMIFNSLEITLILKPSLILPMVQIQSNVALVSSMHASTSNNPREYKWQTGEFQ